jgi:hypothetical protein
MLRQHEIKGFAVLVNGAMKIHPLAFDLDIGLVHPPGAAGFGFSALRSQGNKRRIFHDPPIQCRMVEVDPAFGHNLFQVTAGNRISDIEKHCV